MLALRMTDLLCGLSALVLGAVLTLQAQVASPGTRPAEPLRKPRSYLKEGTIQYSKRLAEGRTFVIKVTKVERLPGPYPRTRIEPDGSRYDYYMPEIAYHYGFQVIDDEGTVTADFGEELTFDYPTADHSPNNPIISGLDAQVEGDTAIVLYHNFGAVTCLVCPRVITMPSTTAASQPARIRHWLNGAASVYVPPDIEEGHITGSLQESTLKVTLKSHTETNGITDYAFRFVVEGEKKKWVLDQPAKKPTTTTSRPKG